MNESRRWLEYFRTNQGDPDEIPWESAIRPSRRRARYLIPSLQQFQLGENAGGVHFLELARQEARRTGDPDFPEAIALFIAEEQRHSALLARYLRQIGAPLARRHPVHSVFRWMRHLLGLETKVTILVTAEILAVPYYRALLEGSRCPALQAICRRVLREEAQHLLFQAATLRRLQRGRPGWLAALTHLAQELFVTGTAAVVWASHRRVFQAGGDSFFDVWGTARIVLRHVQEEAARPADYSSGGDGFRTPAAAPSESPAPARSGW